MLWVVIQSVALNAKSYILLNEHSEYVSMDEKVQIGVRLFVLLCLLCLLWDLTNVLLANTNVDKC